MENRQETPVGRLQYEFEVGAESEGQRLDIFLAAKLGWLSRTRIKEAIREGYCRVNDRPGETGLRLKAGDRVWVAVEPRLPTAMRPEPIPVEVIYEDEYLAVVVKPAGMVVHPTAGNKSGTLANALSYRWNPGLLAFWEKGEPLPRPPVRPGFPHRLDRLTSGLMVVSKTQAVLRELGVAFAERRVKKRYVAILAGKVEADRLKIQGRIGRLSEVMPRWRVTPRGKRAITRLWVTSRAQDRTLVELEPVTGRTNQLRIHCAWIGHPILGDATYGGPPAPRLCLHASLLGFVHPVHGRWMEFVAPMPAEMAALWEQSQGIDAGAHPAGGEQGLSTPAQPSG